MRQTLCGNNGDSATTKTQTSLGREVTDFDSDNNCTSLDEDPVIEKILRAETFEGQLYYEVKWFGHEKATWMWEEDPFIQKAGKLVASFKEADDKRGYHKEKVAKDKPKYFHPATDKLYSKMASWEHLVSKVYAIDKKDGEGFQICFKMERESSCVENISVCRKKFPKKLARFFLQKMIREKMGGDNA